MTVKATEGPLKHQVSPADTAMRIAACFIRPSSVYLASYQPDIRIRTGAAGATRSQNSRRFLRNSARLPTGAVPRANRHRGASKDDHQALDHFLQPPAPSNCQRQSTAHFGLLQSI